MDVETAVAILNGVALFIGWTLMLIGGLCLFACAAAALITRAVERVLRFFDVYREFTAFALPRVRARAKARRERRAG